MSSRFGDIELTVADPEGEDNRRLFANCLWNAGDWFAEAMSGCKCDDKQASKGNPSGNERATGAFNVDGETVLDLGAGLGLGGIVTALAGAKKVMISDYPALEILATIQNNVDINDMSQPSIYKPQVYGHEWGKVSGYFVMTHRHHSTQALALDCLWVPWEHQNLVKSMSYFLPSEIANARIIVIVGYHTGKQNVVLFFDFLHDEDLEIESIEEIDVEGDKRPWVKERDGGKEDVTERKT